jgi:hypothetical protein
VSPLVLLEEAQKLVRMGSICLRLDSDEVIYSDSLRELLELDPSEPPSVEALAGRFRPEERARLLALLRRRDGSGDRGALFSTETGKSVQVKSKLLDDRTTVLGTILEVPGAATLEHELSNLLMVVQGNLDLIRLNAAKPEKIPVHVDLATHAVERLAQLSDRTRLW